MQDVLTISRISELNLQLVAGKEGIGNIVSNVSVYEVSDAYRWFRGNEIIITTFASVPSRYYDEVFAELASRQIAGIILCYPEIYYDKVPDQLIQLANRYRLPLITAPRAVAYVDIMFPILESLIGSDRSQLDFKISIMTEYNRLLMKEALFSDIIAFMLSVLPPIQCSCWMLILKDWFLRDGKNRKLI